MSVARHLLSRGLSLLPCSRSPTLWAPALSPRTLKFLIVDIGDPPRGPHVCTPEFLLACLEFLIVYIRGIHLCPLEDLVIPATEKVNHEQKKRKRHVGHACVGTATRNLLPVQRQLDRHASVLQQGTSCLSNLSLDRQARWPSATPWAGNARQDTCRPIGVPFTASPTFVVWFPVGKINWRTRVN